MDDLISRQAAIDAIRDNESENYITINNLIDKDVAVALLENLPSAQSESEDITFWEKRAREYEEMVLKLIDEMARGIKINSVLITEEGIVFKKEKPEQRWISVNERLPEEKINPNTQDYDWVLCSTTFGDVRAYHFGRGRFLHGCGDVTQYVTAWMPLPALWKEGEAE